MLQTVNVLDVRRLPSADSFQRNAQTKSIKTKKNPFHTRNRSHAKIVENRMTRLASNISVEAE